MFSVRVVLKSLSSLLLARILVPDGCCPAGCGAAVPPGTGPISARTVGCTEAAECCRLWAQCRDSSEGAGICPKGGTRLLLGSWFKMPGLAVSARLLAELKGAGELRQCRGQWLC